MGESGYAALESLLDRSAKGERPAIACHQRLARPQRSDILVPIQRLFAIPHNAPVTMLLPTWIPGWHFKNITVTNGAKITTVWDVLCPEQTIGLR